MLEWNGDVSNQENIETGVFWGTWFKADSSGAFRSAAAWSVIHVTKTQDLSAETYWKTLEEHPDLSGILLESKRSPLVGKGLYNV